jgi:pimeloyl-ACP methyl ester carboxylesterase
MKVGRFFLCTIFWLGMVGAQDYEREQRWAAELVPNLVVGDAVRLKLPSGRDFLGVYAENKTAKTAILLVHGLGVHPDHGLIGILRTSLADAGYATLAIQMPVQNAQATADDYPAVFPEAAARIEAGARWLAAKGYQRLVLLTHSMGGRMANAYYDRAAAAPFSAWISLGITADYGALGKVKASVLDVFGENDFASVLAANPRRRAALVVKGSRQVMIAQADHYYSGRERELAAAIAAFLDRQSSDN